MYLYLRVFVFSSILFHAGLPIPFVAIGLAVRHKQYGVYDDNNELQL